MIEFINDFKQLKPGTKISIIRVASFSSNEWSSVLTDIDRVLGIPICYLTKIDELLDLVLKNLRKVKAATGMICLCEYDIDLLLIGTNAPGNSINDIYFVHKRYPTPAIWADAGAYCVRVSLTKYLYFRKYRIFYNNQT